MPLGLEYPEALLLGALLVWLYWRFVRTRNVWRHLIVAVIVLLLTWPSLRKTSKSLDLIVLADRSRSIPAENLAKEKDLIDLAARNLTPGDRMAVISFSEKAFIELAPSGEAAFKAFETPFSPDGSDLSEGLDTALSVADPDRQTKILVLSDGEYTGQSPVREGQLARQKRIPIHYRELERSSINNLYIGSIDTPDKIMSNEPYRVVFRAHATAPMDGRYRVYRDGRILGESEGSGWRSYQFKVGENQIVYSDVLKSPGIHSYRIEIEPSNPSIEKITADNTAEKFVSVIGERPVLVINNTGQPDNVSQVLTAGGIPIHLTNIANYRFTINQLEGYKGVVMNNVRITGLTRTQIDGLRDFVEQEGGGLLVCGGSTSFAQGGYYRTSLEAVLPVSLEDRKQSKKVSTAFSFVIDRSGSMSVRVPSGQQKIELANEAAIESLNLLTGADSISVIPVDSAPHIFVQQQSAGNAAYIGAQIRRIESMGGGIFVYEGLVAAGLQLAKADQVNKHILLFSDANDSEEPGDYKNLLDDYVKAGITVSVLALGTEADQDSELLKDIAKRGKGQIYFTQDAHQLTQFFTADTITYSRNSFIDKPAPMKVRTAAAIALSPDQKWKDFSCSHYNLLFSREKADVAIWTADGDNAPILAFWQRGLGRCATIALDCDKAFVGQADYPDIILNTSRWIMGSNVFDNFQVQASTEGNYASVNLEVGDDERAKMGEVKLQVFTPDGKTITRPMQWDSHNQLAARFKMEETGAYRGVVVVGDKAYRIGPVSMPVSPEFASNRPLGFGRETLRGLAELTSGSAVLNMKDMFTRTSVSVGEISLLFPLLAIMLALFLLDIAEARFGMAAAAAAYVRTLRMPGRAQAPRIKPARSELLADEPESDTKPLRRTKTLRQPKTQPIAAATEAAEASPEKSDKAEASPPTKPEAPAGGDLMDALSSVKVEARKQFRGKEPKK